MPRFSPFAQIAARLRPFVRQERDALRAILRTLATGLVVTAVLWAGMLHVLSVQTTAAWNAGLENTRNLALVFADNTQRGIRMIDNALLSLRESYLRDPEGLDLAAWTRTRQLATGLTLQFAIIGPDGILIDSSVPDSPRRVDLSDRAHFRAHVGQSEDTLFISRPVRGRVSGKLSVQVTRPIRTADGRFAGVVVASLDPAYLGEFYGGIDLGTDGGVMLVGTDHVLRAVSAGPSPLEVGETLPHALWEETAPDGHVTWRGPDGVERLVAFRQVPDLPLVLLVTESTSEVLAEAVQARHAYLLAALLLTALIAAAVATVASQQWISHRARSALRRSAAEQQATLENMSQGIMMIEPDGTIAVLNHQAVEMLGLPSTMATGRPRLQSMLAWQIAEGEFGPEGSPTRAQAGSALDLRAGAESPAGFEWRRPDGRWIEVRSVGLPDGRLVRTFTDVTIRKETELALAGARDAAQAATRARSDFLAVMSHEMRTPLNGVIGMASLLRESGLLPHQVAFAETLDASARHLLQLIDDVLDFSRLEAAQVTLEEVPFDPAALVRTVAEMLAPRAGEKGLKLACAIDPVLAAGPLIGDPGRLRQVLLNLAGNAVKFTETGGLAITARVLTHRPGEVTVGFTVADTGIGIAPAARPQLFQEFAQGDTSISRRFGGTGLGLAISRRLIHAMHGEIDFESEVGAGAVFRFAVRLQGNLATPIAELAERRLLLLDPLDLTRRTLLQEFGAQGARATGVDTVGAALDRLAAASQSRPDAILLDCPDPEAAAAQLRPLVGPTTLLVGIGPAPRRVPPPGACLDAWMCRPVLTEAVLAVLADAARTQDAAVAPVRPVRHLPAPPQLGLNVLLAEDDRVNQQVALAMLERVGCRTTLVTDGAAALEAARHGGWDLVLMDLMMPEMDGLTALRALRTLPAPEGAVPVVMLTAAASTEDMMRCRAAGANAFLTKPIDLGHLRRVLSAVADGREAASAAPDKVGAEEA